jgi:hypothetical protein
VTTPVRFALEEVVAGDILVAFARASLAFPQRVGSKGLRLSLRVAGVLGPDFSIPRLAQAELVAFRGCDSPGFGTFPILVDLPGATMSLAVFSIRRVLEPGTLALLGLSRRRKANRTSAANASRNPRHRPGLLYLRLLDGANRGIRSGIDRNT